MTLSNEKENCCRFEDRRYKNGCTRNLNVFIATRECLLEVSLQNKSIHHFYRLYASVILFLVCYLCSQQSTRCPRERAAIHMLGIVYTRQIACILSCTNEEQHTENNNSC